MEKVQKNTLISILPKFWIFSKFSFYLGTLRAIQESIDRQYVNFQKYGTQAPRYATEVIPTYGDEVLDRAGLPKCGLPDLFPVANNLSGRPMKHRQATSIISRKRKANSERMTQKNRDGGKHVVLINSKNKIKMRCTYKTHKIIEYKIRPDDLRSFAYYLGFAY